MSRYVQDYNCHCIYWSVVVCDVSHRSALSPELLHTNVEYMDGIKIKQTRLGCLVHIVQ